MLFQVAITRYENTLDPDPLVAWRTVHIGVDQFQALELTRKATRGFLGELTEFDIVDEAETPVPETDLVALAYATARRDSVHRARFADWVVDRLAEILFPWDDAVRIPTPPPTYWFRASCWLRRMLGDVEDWLAEQVDAAYGANLRSELVRHDARAANGTRLCAHTKVTSTPERS